MTRRSIRPRALILAFLTVAVALAAGACSGDSAAAWTYAPAAPTSDSAIAATPTPDHRAICVVGVVDRGRGNGQLMTAAPPTL